MKKSHEFLFAMLFLLLFGFTIFTTVPNPIDWRTALSVLRDLFQGIPFRFWLGFAGMFLLIIIYGTVTMEKRKQQRQAEIEKFEQEIEALPPIKNRTREMFEKIVIVLEKLSSKEKQKRPAHRPAMDDAEAIRLIVDEKKSYGQAFDILFPPKQGKEDIERLSGFETWRTRVSKKVNAEFDKFKT